jgi:rhodanese-related sulfurtransferase
VSTIGEQRRSNYALQPMSRDSFLELVTTDQPDAPAYFTYDAVLNSRERPTLDQALARELRPVVIDELLAEQAKGAQILDTRDPAEFAAAHLEGSLNIGLLGQYATWAGTILRHDEPIVVIADPGMETESAMRLGRIGFDNVIGYLNDGLRSVEGSSARIVSTERIGAGIAAQRLASSAPPLVVDVRTPTERAQKRIAGSVHIPLSRLMERMNEIPPDRPVLVHCAGGYRSSIAASLLQRHGRSLVSELAGGIAGWEMAGH